MTSLYKVNYTLSSVYRGFIIQDFCHLLEFHLPAWISAAKQFEVEAITHGRPLWMLYQYVSTLPSFNIRSVQRSVRDFYAYTTQSEKYYNYVCDNINELVKILEEHNFISKAE